MKTIILLVTVLFSLFGCDRQDVENKTQPADSHTRPSPSETTLDNNPAIETSLPSFPEPTESQVIKRLKLWATFYKIHVARAVSDGIPLIDRNNQSLGVSLSGKDWCEAALEGTVAIKSGEKVTVYNYADSRGASQCDCQQFYPSLADNVLRGMSKTRFVKSDAPFGYGVKGWHLTPYRTIAVDNSVIAYGTVVYIPKARGIEVTMPNGEKIIHDGYFYAGDRGGAIKDNHIDVFSGFYQRNPFPEFIKNSPDKTFDAFIVRNDAIQAALDMMHKK